MHLQIPLSWILRGSHVLLQKSLICSLWKHIMELYPNLRAKYQHDSLTRVALRHLFVGEQKFDESFWQRNFPTVYEENITRYRQLEDTIKEKYIKFSENPTEHFEWNELYYFFKYDIAHISIISIYCKMCSQPEFHSLLDMIRIISHYKSSKVLYFNISPLVV